MSQPALKNPAEAFIIMLYKNNAKTKKDLFQVQRAIAKSYNIGFQNQDKLVAAYRKLVLAGDIKANKVIESLIRLKNTRSLSGIVVVSVLTKPYICPGHCLYCPTQNDVPKSYLANEPAVMRAIANNFDPYRQVISRLSALSDTGHPIDKVNIRIIGGTWSYYPTDYQEWFISELFRACNEFQNDKCRMTNAKQKSKDQNVKNLGVKSVDVSFDIRNFDFGISRPTKQQLPSCHQSLDNLQSTNEMAQCRIVEISIETRQDYINIDEIRRLREYGVTKVELGVQTIYDNVLIINKRGNLNVDTINATKMLRDAGFKVSYQIMPNLPGSNLKRDEEMFKKLFSNSDYQPDYIKIYPLALVKQAEVYKLYQEKKFKPYSKEELVGLLKTVKTRIPRYCRIERVIRDIPAPEIIEGGAKNSNLRQIVLDEMAAKGNMCQCIRCREIKTDISNPSQAKMFRQDYEANGGHEIFLTIESPDRKTLYSLLRLRIPSNEATKPWSNVLQNAALIREVHTYGRQLAIGTVDETAAQHQGYGKILIQEAENIAKEEYGLDKIAVISGIGVRDYFRKLKYELKDTYMVKKLKTHH